ncbi:MAG: FecR domain-containing protein [Cyclobacteriaceae bacterium]
MSEPNNDLSNLLKNEYFVQWVVNPTEESIHYWTKWLQSHRDQQSSVDLARQIIQSANYRIDHKMPEKLYDDVLVNLVNYNQKRKSQLYKLNTRNWETLRVAASIILLISIGLFIAQKTGFFGSSKKDLVTQVTKSTEWGQKKTISLPDGTVVKLNSGSSLSYPNTFSSELREVELVGEAFFDVETDKARPFIVKTKNIKTTVLGTEFNINAYSYNSIASITLAEGSVSVEPLVNQISSSKEQMILNPGEQASLDFTNGRFYKQEVVVEDVISWKDGVLLFQSEPLKIVFDKLSKWYGVDFDLPKSLAQSDCLLNGEFRNESLETVLQSIALVHELKFEFKNNNMIEIRGDTCK